MRVRIYTRGEAIKKAGIDWFIGIAYTNSDLQTELASQNTGEEDDEVPLVLDDEQAEMLRAKAREWQNEEFILDL